MKGNVFCDMALTYDIPVPSQRQHYFPKTTLFELVTRITVVGKNRTYPNTTAPKTKCNEDQSGTLHLKDKWCFIFNLDKARYHFQYG